MLGCAHTGNLILKIMGLLPMHTDVSLRQTSSPSVVVHTALLPLMLVAAPSQTTLSSA